MCLGAIDGTHIAIEPPMKAATDYYNYKKFHSIIMLATVNSHMKFTYINIGAPGRCNDASVFNRSNLAQIIKHEDYATHYMMINNTRVQSHLIADSAFGLSSTLLKPYPERPNMPDAHSLFNYRLSRCRSTVERAFGLLKRRFRCLNKKMEYNLGHTTTIIQAATIIHNMCIDDNDIGDTDWDICTPVYKKPACNTHTSGGSAAREALTHFFLLDSL